MRRRSRRWPRWRFGDCVSPNGLELAARFVGVGLAVARVRVSGPGRLGRSGAAPPQGCVAATWRLAGEVVGRVTGNTGPSTLRVNQSACASWVEDGTGLSNWRERYEWARLCWFADVAGLAGGLFCVRGTVSRAAFAVAAGGVAGA